MGNRMLSVLACTSAVALGLTQAYKVEPAQQSWSGWTEGEDGYVSQIVTANFDELDSVSGGYVQLFTGLRGAGGNYNLEILEAGDGPTVAREDNRPAGLNHAWLTFDRIKMETGQSFTKGKQYEFRFTRSGSDTDLVGLDCVPADATMA